MGICFCLLASGTAFNVLADELGKARPPIVSGDKLLHLEEPRVTGGFVVMTAKENLVAQIPGWWDIDSPFVGEDSCRMLPVREVGSESCRYLFLGRLEKFDDNRVVLRVLFDEVVERGIGCSDKDGWRKETSSFVLITGVRKEIRSSR